MRELELGGLTVRLTGGSDGAGGGDGPVVVLLHGFGAPGVDLVPLGGEIDAPDGTRFVFPEAPLTLPPAFGSGGRAWWMIDVMKLQLAMLSGQTRDLTKEVPEGLAEAHAAIAAMLSGLENEIGMQRERTVLGGFSQGAMLATDVVLRGDEDYAGLVIMSGTLLAEDEWLPLLAKRNHIPVFQSHGTGDPLLPYAAATRLRHQLEGAGADVTWVSFAGGHGIAPNVHGSSPGGSSLVMTELGAFLRRIYSS